MIVCSSLVDEILMLAGFDDDTVVDNSDDVSIDDGGESVSDQYCGSAFSSFVQSVLDDLKELDKLMVFRLNLTFSLSVSSALVASSRSRIFGFRIRALAMAIRCFWPPLSCDPFLPHRVSSR